MSKKNDYDFTVPWTENGVPWNVYHGQNGVEWRPNDPFKAALKVKRLYKQSTSSFMAEMINEATGEKFVMRSEDFIHAIHNTAPIFGTFIGAWRFRRTAKQYYGLEFLGKD